MDEIAYKLTRFLKLNKKYILYFHGTKFRNFKTYFLFQTWGLTYRLLIWGLLEKCTHHIVVPLNQRDINTNRLITITPTLCVL